VLRIFSPLKNPTASAGFEPANLGTKGQHATPRQPKPLPLIYVKEIIAGVLKPEKLKKKIIVRKLSSSCMK